MKKDFKDFRKMIVDQKIVEKIIANTPVGEGTQLTFALTPDGLENYSKELSRACIATSMIATIDFLQLYHQWLNDDLDKE